MQITPIIGNPDAPPFAQQSAREFGFNSQLAAPMIREGKVIGAIITAHRDTAAFNDKQVALIKTFAAQAVIAIENARLLNELRQRTDDLTEALEQQTATAEVLSAISSSPGDLRPVFQTMLANAYASAKRSLACCFSMTKENWSFVPPQHGTCRPHMLKTLEIIRLDTTCESLWASCNYKTARSGRRC